MSALNTSLPSANAATKDLIGSIQAPDYTSLLKGLGGNSPAVSAFADLTNQANQANAKRGQDILALLQNQGKAQMALNQNNYQDQLGNINQGIVSKGLYNSTVGANLQQGATNWLNTANEQVSENSAMNIANMANSFTQQAPSLSLLTQLLASGGNSRIGGGGTSTTGLPGFKQPGTMLDGGGGGALNVNNQAQSGYASAMSPLQNATNAAYGFNGQTAWSSDPFMTSVPMQNTAASNPGIGATSPSGYNPDDYVDD